MGVTLTLPLAAQASDEQEPGITIAILDSGLNPHDVGQESTVLPGYNMVSESGGEKTGRSPNAKPDESSAHCNTSHNTGAHKSLQKHGAQVARTLLGELERFASEGSERRAGAAKRGLAVRLLPVRIYGDCKITRKDMMDALAWAAGLLVEGLPLNPNPAKVINLSFTGGASHCGADLQKLISKLVAMQIFVVAAAGNSYHRSLREPANCDGVLAVGATTADHRIEDYTALDPRIGVYAFGGEKPSATDAAPLPQAGNYALASVRERTPPVANSAVGTSFAAPLVSARLARWAAQHPGMGMEHFRSQLDQFSFSVQAPLNCPSCQPRVLAPLATVYPI